jgi:hypothetical protein
MKITKETKIVYKALEITPEEKAFCEQIIKLAEDAIADEAVAPYYENHEDELILGFLQDIANAGAVDLHDYE